MGALAVTVMLKIPAGIWGTIARRFDLYLFPTARRLVPRASDRPESEAGQ
jgi:hypothetical protein